MILSNLMTANNLDEKPAMHVRANTVKITRLFHPEGLNNKFFTFAPESAERVAAIVSKVADEKRRSALPRELQY
jgi:hypothetical protein